VIDWKDISKERLAWVLPVIVFVALVLVHSDLPGIYMDAANPDFLAAQWLHRGHNPGAGIPSKIFPLLGSFYHGLQNAYLGVPIFAIAGFSVTSLRLEQAVFGVILLIALYHLTRRLTASIPLALLASVGLATELAFTASFRTQFYIVLGGAAWLFVSLLLALPAAPESWIVKRRAFWSGVFFGLASYGYFVLAFFAPAMAVLVAIWVPRRQWGQWIVGALVGVSPFALGFLSLLAKKHGLEPTLDFIRGMLGQLKPFDTSGASGNHLVYAWDLVRLATSDAGNEAMIFAQPLPGDWSASKVWWLVGGALGLLSFGGIERLRGRQGVPYAVLAFMPVSFFAVASLFGPRLWSHHFSVLVPFVYLLPVLVLAQCLRYAFTRVDGRVENVTLAVVALVVLGGNLFQQTGFHESLVKTGGRGRSTEALTQLADEARSVPANVAYLFPDWGFFTSFCFLTENRVRYGIDAEARTMERMKRDGVTEIRLVYWNASDEQRFRSDLQASGLRAIEHRTFVARDGITVFHWLRGVFTVNASRLEDAKLSVENKPLNPPDDLP